jgi:hypothetical protein
VMRKIYVAVERHPVMALSPLYLCSRGTDLTISVQSRLEWNRLGRQRWCFPWIKRQIYLLSSKQGHGSFPEKSRQVCYFFFLHYKRSSFSKLGVPLL